MTTTQRRRMLWVVLIMCGMGIAVGLTLYALQQNISLFYTPSQVVAGEAPAGQLIRVGGLVAPGSVHHAEEGLQVSFAITDNQHTILVHYHGLLPDLFREGQGIVVQGRVDNTGAIQATQVLAKHDENYMPPEVANALNAQGHPQRQ